MGLMLIAPRAPATTPASNTAPSAGPAPTKHQTGLADPVAARALDRLSNFTDDVVFTSPVAVRVVGGDGPGALALVRSHLAEFPRDALLLSQNAFLAVTSGDADRNSAQLAFLSTLAPAYGDDWFFLSSYGFVHHELDRFADSRRLSERDTTARVMLLALGPLDPTGAVEQDGPLPLKVGVNSGVALSAPAPPLASAAAPGGSERGYTASGALQKVFGSNGCYQETLASTAVPYQLLVGRNAYWVLLADTSNARRFTLLRLTITGQPDTTYGAAGRRTFGASTRSVA